MRSKRLRLVLRTGIAAVAVATVMAVWPAQAAAQHRGRGVVVRPRTSIVVGVGAYRPYYYDSFFYDPFFFGYGWSPAYWQYPYPPYYGPYPYGRYAYGNWAAARIEVKPKNAQVYLDGYYVGVVDQFDGVFQRLDVPAGEHELVVYLDGYRSYRQRTLFRPGETYHFKGELQPLANGEAPEPKPQPAPPPNANAPYAPRAPYGPPRGYQPPPPPPGWGAPAEPRQMPPEPRAPEPGMREEASGFGTLAIRVQPADATVTIDGERWDSPEGGSRLQVQLAAGRHTIEVQKDGYRSYSTTVEIRPGETQTLNVSLPQ